jgi:hypothetical protein
VKESQLENTLAKVAQLIFLCEQALAIHDTIVEKARQINERKLNHFFVPVQYAFFQTFALDMCKIFELPKRYSVHSLPMAIRLLEGANLKQRTELERACLRYGPTSLSLSRATNEDLVELYKSEITKELGSRKITDKLESFKAVRDKFVAHSEIVTVNTSLNRQEANCLLGFSKRIVSTIGHCFLNTIYSDDDGNFVLDSDAGRASRAARRILEYVGIVALERTHDDIRAAMLARMIRDAEWPEAVKAKVRQSL